MLLALPDRALVEANEAHARSLGHLKIPFSNDSIPHPLAICGGGPSLRHNVAEIIQCPVVFAINGAYSFLKSRGVDCTFISVDPFPEIARMAKGAERAIVATRCHPDTFKALEGSWVRVFDVPGDVRGGSSTATTFIELSSKMGFRKVIFFGCEASFRGDSHAYGNEDIETMLVEADGKTFRTRLDYYAQAIEMSEGIRKYPGALCERSGGLLRAMVRDPRHRVSQQSQKQGEIAP